MEDQKAIVEKKTLQIPTTLKSLIEALVFSSDEPLSVKDLRSLYSESSNGLEQRELESSEIENGVAALNEEYISADRPYRIISVGGGYLFATQKEYAEWIGLLSWEQSRRKLSQSALESLSIIAYKQPISKPEIEAIRGVNCDYVLKSLLEKDLVTITGRANTVGRPLLYGTTRQFLMHFGLNSVTDLPRPREIEEILGESQFETERRMLEAQHAAEKLKREAEDFKSRLPHIPKRKADMDESVQIVPKERTRDIKVRRPKSIEGQTEIPFEQSDSPVPLPPFLGNADILESGESPFVSFDPRLDMQPEISEPIEDPDASRRRGEELPLPQSEMTSKVEELQPERLAEAPEIGPQKNPVIQPEISSADEAGDLDVEQKSEQVLLAEASFAGEDVVEVTNESRQEVEEHHARSRWQEWKEKVQTFIKKLFA